MLAIFIVKKEPLKNTNFSFFKGHFFVMGGPIDMNLACFKKLLWAL